MLRFVFVILFVALLVLVFVDLLFIDCFAELIMFVLIVVLGFVDGFYFVG